MKQYGELTEKQPKHRGSRYAGRSSGDATVRSEMKQREKARRVEDAPLASRRKIDPAKVEKAVAETAAEAGGNYNVPLYNWYHPMPST